MDLGNTLAATAGANEAAPERKEPIELSRGAAVGRYLVLGKLGAGAMGVVYAAHDPELDRKVALKLLLPRSEGVDDGDGRTRLLREAQALAKLSHPNVVAVHDAGTHGDKVWVAMEFVAGQTLSEWAQQQRRRWPEVLQVLADAARGVAAAHMAGLIHRDLKPDNIMVGRDGRVRVMDFGLAYRRNGVSVSPALASTLSAGAEAPPEIGVLALRLTAPGSIQGTPAYMAPEQWQGQEAQTSTDQFGWSIMAWELLYGERPFAGENLMALAAMVLSGQRRTPPKGRRVPSWLRRVVERGLATDPSRRWPTMTALLAALERGRTRARVKIGALALSCTVIAGGYVFAHAIDSNTGVVCPDARIKLRSVWDDRRADVERGLLATKAVYAADTFARVAPRLDQYADTWAAGHHDACTAHAAGEQSSVLLDLRMACLERRRSELATLVDRLAGADSDTVGAAALAVDGLIAPEQCADTAALTAAVPLPEDPAAADRVVALREQLAEARVAVSTAKLAEAATIVTEVVAAAGPLDFPPLLAEALAVRGSVEVGRGEYEPASKSLEEALWLADTVHDDALLADTMANLVHLLGVRLTRFDDALRWRRHADAVIVRLGAATPGHSALLRAFGITAGTQGRPAEARELLQRALTIDEALAGSHEGKVIKDLIALGTSEFQAGDAALARTYQERALALGEQFYGPNHPEIARILANLATAVAGVGDYDAAAPLFERALTIIEATYGLDHAIAAGTLTNLGAVHAMRGRYDLAQPMFERALAILERTVGPDHPDIAAPVHNIGVVADQRGDLAGARRYHQRALAIREHHFPPGSPEVASSLARLGDISYREGNLTMARRDLERAIAFFIANTAHAFQDGLPNARFILAKVLRDAGDGERAIAEARQAVTEYRALNLAGNVEEIEAWLTSIPSVVESTK